MSATAAHDAPRLSLGPAEFERIARIARKEAGLDVRPKKRMMVQSRLAARLRHLKLTDFATYCDLVESAEGAGERLELVSRLTTNVSQFFREAHHFELLTQDLSSMPARARLRIWSAGCAHGQEPSSIAMTLAEAGLLARSPDVKILGTDIDRSAITFAQRGRYPANMLTGLDPKRRETHFLPVPETPGETALRPELRRHIVFRHLNLLSPWPMKGLFDVIFCRNVAIYFDEATQHMLWNALARFLAPGGLLLIGHSERVSGSAETMLHSLGRTAYRRVAQSGRQPERTDAHGLA